MEVTVRAREVVAGREFVRSYAISRWESAQDQVVLDAVDGCVRDVQEAVERYRKRPKCPECAHPLRWVDPSLDEWACVNEACETGFVRGFGIPVDLGLVPVREER